MLKKYISLFMVFQIVLVSVFTATAADKAYQDKLDWAIRAKRLQKWQDLDPDEVADNMGRSKLIVGALVSVVAAVKGSIPSDELSFESGFMMDVVIGWGIAHIIGGPSRKKMHREQNEWNEKVDTGIMMGYLPYGVSSGQDIEIVDAVRGTSFGSVFWETMGGAWGPFLLFGKAVINLPKRPEAAFLLLPCVALWPFSVPYGVYAVGDRMNQGAKYTNALFGSLIAIVISYMRYDAGEYESTEYGYDDFSDYYFGSMNSYFMTVVLSVLTYNMLKPKSGVDIQYSGNKEALKPVIYLSMNTAGNYPILHLNLLNFYF